MHYLLMSEENWMRNKWFRACRAWESTYKQAKEDVWGVGHGSSPMIVTNLVMIHQPWLKRISGESAIVAQIILCWKLEFCKANLTPQDKVISNK